MYICPICHQNNAAPQCSCGFDASRDYEGYPTLALLPGPVPSRSASAAELKDYLHCRKCGSLSFRFHLQRGALLCSSCGAEQSFPSASVSSPVAEKNPGIRPAIAVGGFHTVGLRTDGTVIAVGDDSITQSGIHQWTDIVSIAAYSISAAGLRKDGTVLYTGWFGVDTTHWKDITAIALGDSHILGLRKDGTVLAAGDNFYGQCDVSTWRDIIAVAGGENHSVGLKKDGTLVTAGAYVRQNDLNDWTDIIAIGANHWDVYALRRDGTVLTTSRSQSKKISDWRDITAIATMYEDVVGLKKDGTVVTTNASLRDAVTQWQNVIAIDAGTSNIAALLRDGTVVAAGDNSEGQCNVSGWKLF